MSKVAVKARPAVPADIGNLVALCLEARSESAVHAQLCSSSDVVLHEQLGAVFALPDMHLVVVDLDGGLVGFALARVVLPGLFCDVGWLQVEALYVAPAHRRRGAGHALMAALAELARSENAERVVAMPLTGARSEQRFLARLGFAAAAAHRIAETAALARRMEAECRPGGGRRRAQGLESLIAERRRNRTRSVGAQAAPAGTESSSMHVRRAVHTRPPDSSVTTIS